MDIIIEAGVTIEQGVSIGQFTVNIPGYLATQDNNQLVTESGDNLVTQKFIKERFKCQI